MSRKSLYIFLLILECVLFQDNIYAQEQYDPKYLYKFTIDANIEQTKAQALDEYKICPPLRLERFRRKVKVLWGIDINDYPDNSLIWINDFIVISKKYQLVFNKFEPHDEFPFETPDFTREEYSYFRQFLYMNDNRSFEKLQKSKDEYLSKLDDNGFMQDIHWFSDLIYIYYRYLIFKIDEPVLTYIDQNARNGYQLLSQNDSEGVALRIGDMRFDLLSLYTTEQKQKSRKIANSPKENSMWLGISLIDKDPAYTDGSTPKNYISEMAIYNVNTSEKNENSELFHRQIWRNYTAEKGICAYLSFLLQLKDKIANKLVIQFMSGQIGRDDLLYNNIRTNIKKNNYYGYSILREFCENPMREMPTLKKIGTNLTAKVKQAKTLLLLEPFADSFDIDTIQLTETFKAYEMGHDDYYFVEIEKPVESPVANKDGYAMILDRTETVYGYLPKSEVKEYTSQNVLTEKQYTDKTQSKRGVIQDKDGYVNIRREANSQSEVVGKIVDKEIFHYWQTSDNWYIVETKNGLRGYVYKDRIREKYDTGSWIIDE